MSWHLNAPMCGFDLETTGISVEDDRVVTACVVFIRPTPTPPYDVTVHQWLVNPGIEIPQGAIDVHHITNERAQAEGQEPAGALEDIAATLAIAQVEGIPLVGANLAYDNTLLDRELRRYGLRTMEERLGRPLGPCIDVQVLDKQVDPFRSKAEGDRKLTTLCRLYGVALNGAHDSTQDALGAVRVAFRLGRMSQMSVEDLVRIYGGRKRPAAIANAIRSLGDLTLDELHEAQIGWRSTQQDGLRAYFDKAGTKHDGVDGSWPLIPAAAQAVLA